MKKKTGLLCMVAACLYLSACSSMPLVTDVDFLVHQGSGTLPAFYQQLQNDLKLAKPGSEVAQNRQFYIEKTGQTIADEKVQALLNGLDREFGKHSIAVLQSALHKAAEISHYNEKAYADMVMQLEQAISQKKGVILAKEAEFYELSDTDAPAKMRLLEEIVAIYGPGAEADQVQQQQLAYLDDLYRKAQAAVDGKRYDDAILLVGHITQIQPAYANLEAIRQQLAAADFEQQLWDALEKGSTDKAYATFYKLTQIPGYLQSHPDVVPVAEDIAEFFVADGDQWVKQKSYENAYQSYSRARYIKNAIGKSGVYSPGEKKFTAMIEKRLAVLVRKDALIPAYGHWLILRELMPDHPAIAAHVYLQDAVLSDATIKIIAGDFPDGDVPSPLGDNLALAVRQKLQLALPGQLELIDRSEAATAYTPAQIVSLRNPSSYYVFSGEVVSARIGRKEKKLTDTRRVVTAYVEETNPAYQQWLDLGKRQQKDIPVPAKTISRPIEEDVLIHKTQIEQTSDLSVAYRLADAVSASVVYSDALSGKVAFPAEIMPALERGIFVLPGKTAELRSDGEILEALVDETAGRIADNIASQVADMQRAYLRTADKAIVLEDFELALKHYAYSYALSEAQESPDQDVLARLRIYALRFR